MDYESSKFGKNSFGLEYFEGRSTRATSTAAQLGGSLSEWSLWRRKFVVQGWRLWLRKMKGLRWVRAEEGAIPNIKQLYLHRLPLMEELPFGVERLRQLQKLDISRVSPVLTSKLWMEEFKESEDYKRIAHIPQVIIIFQEDGKWRKKQL